MSGEVKFTLKFGDTELPIDGLVNGKMDCNSLEGVPFCKANNIELHLKEEEITISGKHILYGPKPDSIQHDISLMKSCTLRNNVSRVLFPGDLLEIYDNNLSNYEGEIAVELRFDSPLNGEWPEPCLSQVIQGTIRIPNFTNEPVQLSKSQHFAQIWRVIAPPPAAVSIGPMLVSPKPILQNTESSSKILFSSAIDLDPDNQLNPSESNNLLICTGVN